MIIKNSEFIISAVKRNQYPIDGRNEIAFVGRSNVGKSSIINALTNRRKLAKVSQTPGKTRLINFFLINNDFYLVDLPGYGYAKVSKKEKESWGKTIEMYLTDREELKRYIEENGLSEDVINNIPSSILDGVEKRYKEIYQIITDAKI